MNMKLRIICVENDFGEAANVGGPCKVTHKTVDVEPVPDELVAWLKGKTQWRDRWVEAVEVIEQT